MKLLFFGAVLVVVGIVALAAMEWVIEGVRAPETRIEPAPPVVRFVTAGREGNGASAPKTIVWQTSTALENCADVMRWRKRDEQKRLSDLVSSAVDASLDRQDDKPCAPFQLGEVEDGAKVELLDEYGRMARVRILSGRLQGRQGYIERDRLGGAG